MRNTYFCSFLLLLLFALPANVCALDKIRVGAVLHLTGDLAMPSAAFREGIELAFEEFNRREDRPFDALVLFEDGKNDSRTSNTASRKLLSIDKVRAAIISSYLDAMASANDYEKARVPALVLWDSNPELDDVSDYIFCIGPWTPSAGERGARFAADKLKARSAAVFTNQDAWSISVGQYFKEEFQLLGGNIVAEHSLNPDQTDFRAILSKTKSIAPDIIYTPLVHNLVAFYSQVEQLGLASIVMSSDIITAEHIKAAPEAFEGVYQAGIADPDSAAFQRLAGKYESKFGRKISMPWFVAIGYDGAALLLDSITHAGASGEALKQQLYKVNNFSGASGNISINEKGTSPVLESMYRITNGELVLVEK